MESINLTTNEINFIKSILSMRMDYLNKDIDFYGKKADDLAESEDYEAALRCTKRVNDCLGQKLFILNLLEKFV